MTQEEVVGWHHRFNGHELGQTPGDSEGQGGLACCSPWGHRELDMTEPLNDNNIDLCYPHQHPQLLRDLCLRPQNSVIP